MQMWPFVIINLGNLILEAILGNVWIALGIFRLYVAPQTFLQLYTLFRIEVC